MGYSDGTLNLRLLTDEAAQVISAYLETRALPLTFWTVVVDQWWGPIRPAGYCAKAPGVIWLWPVPSDALVPGHRLLW